MNVPWSLTLSVLALWPSLPSASPVRLRSAFDAELAGRAVRRAARLLETPSCREILAEFEDANGRPLQAVLDGVGMTPAEYLRGHVVFHDGSGEGRCAARGTLAYTTPRSRIVHLCPRFLAKELERPAFTQVVVIHEMLHTLGLGEDPPSSREISDRVQRRCASP